MKILLDEDVYAVTGRFLKALNHKVISAQELGLSGCADEVILRSAMEQRAVLMCQLNMLWPEQNRDALLSMIFDSFRGGPMAMVYGHMF